MFKGRTAGKLPIRQDTYCLLCRLVFSFLREPVPLSGRRSRNIRSMIRMEPTPVQTAIGLRRFWRTTPSQPTGTGQGSFEASAFFDRSFSYKCRGPPLIGFVAFAEHITRIAGSVDGANSAVLQMTEAVGSPAAPLRGLSGYGPACDASRLINPRKEPIRHFASLRCCTPLVRRENRRRARSHTRPCRLRGSDLIAHQAICCLGRVSPNTIH